MEVKKIGPWIGDRVTVSDGDGNEAHGILEMTARKNGKMMYRIEKIPRWWPHCEVNDGVCSRQ